MLPRQLSPFLKAVLLRAIPQRRAPGHRCKQIESFISWPVTTLSVWDPSAVPSISRGGILNAKNMSWDDIPQLVRSGDTEAKSKVNKCRDFPKTIGLFSLLGRCWLPMCLFPGLNDSSIMVSVVLGLGPITVYFLELGIPLFTSLTTDFRVTSRRPKRVIYFLFLTRCAS